MHGLHNALRKGSKFCIALYELFNAYFYSSHGNNTFKSEKEPCFLLIISEALGSFQNFIVFEVWGISADCFHAWSYCGNPLFHPLKNE